MSPMELRSIVNPNGHDFVGKPNLDAVGVTYITFAVLYTLVVLAGLVALWIHRHNEVVRLRSVPLSFTAIATLQVYLVLVLAVYPENGLFACGTEFWIMSIALPFGMGLFQACNVQVFSYAERQERLIHCESLENLPLRKQRFRCTPRGLLTAWKQLSFAEKTYVGIFIGFVTTLMTTLFLYFGSRMFHVSYGFFGKFTTPAQCRRGYEWIPSIFWQLFWTVFFGPYILYKIRHLRDVHSWALQTRIAILCGFPGTPLWLLFVYGKSTGISAINKYWVPAAWFLPCLIAMQTTLWAIPVYEAVQSNYRKREETAAFVAEKIQRPETPSNASQYSTVTFNYFNNAIAFSTSDALLKLQRYCAETTMNGELVAFLRHETMFAKKWENKALTDETHRQMFRDAALIYFGLVHEKYADIPINLPFKEKKALDEMFKDVKFSPFREDSSNENVVTPWVTFDDDRSFTSSNDNFEDDTKPINGEVMPATPTVTVHGEKHILQVPNNFDINVFKPALQVIKHDIYNSKAFHRFYQHEQAAREAASESQSTDQSNTSRGSRLMRIVDTLKL